MRLHVAPCVPLAAWLLLGAGAARADDPPPAPPDAPAAAPLTRPLPAAATALHERAGADTGRPRAVEVGGGYERRLAVHRWGSYAMYPLFAAQYVLGERMYAQKTDLRAGRRTEPIGHGVRVAHRASAIAVSGVFAVNTVTGVWNWYDSRGVADRRALRTVHALSMLATDAGFAASSALGLDHRKHRNVAIGSMTVAALSAAAMLAFNRD